MQDNVFASSKCCGRHEHINSYTTNKLVEICVIPDVNSEIMCPTHFQNIIDKISLNMTSLKNFFVPYFCQFSDISTHQNGFCPSKRQWTGLYINLCKQ